MALEVLRSQKHSHASDVWALGILYWELFSFGKPPYPTMTAVETVAQLSVGYRLPQPSACPDYVYVVRF